MKNKIIYRRIKARPYQKIMKNGMDQLEQMTFFFNLIHVNGTHRIFQHCIRTETSICMVTLK